MSVFYDVLAFMEIGHPDKIADGLGVPPVEIDKLCRRLVREEYEELQNALAHADLPGIADGIGDLIWVLLCLAYAYGIPIEEVWHEIADTNMDKFPDGKVLRREDGKILKPEGWKPPDVKGILERLGSVKKCTYSEGSQVCGQRRNASVHAVGDSEVEYMSNHFFRE